MSSLRPMLRLPLRPTASTSRLASSSSLPAASPPASPRPLSHPVYASTPVPRPSTYPSRFPGAPAHTHVSHPAPLFASPPRAQWPAVLGQDVGDKNERLLAAVTGLAREDVRGLYRAGVVLKRVVNMTKKGKQPSWFALLVVGSPEKGLVGIGRGRGLNVQSAMDHGFHKAVLSMDHVDKFENRTLWGQGADLTHKLGATTVTLRARPPGFGLQVPHALHRLLSAAGIRDASATIEGSRNPVVVLKCAIQILHGGFGPPGLGSGTGRPGRREDKGAGMRSVQDIERERGRRGIDVGKRL
ncbi:28S ribosomal protein S5, mitochondrial [Cryptotrichosporon argae]